MQSIFLGKWELISDKSEYSKGKAPKKAIYEFKKNKNIGFDVFIKWIDFEGKKYEVVYNTIPDGQRKKYENPQIADEIMSEFESNNILNSYTYKNGKTISNTSRIIYNEEEMKVIQRFYKLDGNHFDNIQFYKKIKHEKPF